MTCRSSTSGDMRGVLAALLRRAPAATRACPLPSGRLGILQSSAALLTTNNSAASSSSSSSSCSSSPSVSLLIPEPEWRSLREDMILSTLAAAACGNKKDRLVLWDAFLAPELHAAFPTLLPGFRPHLTPSGVLLQSGRGEGYLGGGSSAGGDDWLVLALFPVQKGALSLTVTVEDGSGAATALSSSNNREGGGVGVVYRSLGVFDARGVFFNRLKKALYHGWTNRSREGAPVTRVRKGRPAPTRIPATALPTPTVPDKASEWSDLFDGSGLTLIDPKGVPIAVTNTRFHFADAVADPSLMIYVEAALRNYARDARIHLKTLEDVERERLQAAAAAVFAPSAAAVSSPVSPTTTPATSGGGGSRFRKKVESVQSPSPPPTPAAAPTAPPSRFKKKAAVSAPLVSGVAPSPSSVSVSPQEKPVHHNPNEPQVDRRVSWSDTVRDGARSPFRKVQGGYNLGYYLSMTDDLNIIGGPHAWQALLPMAAMDGHLKQPVLLSPAASEVPPNIPQQRRVVELLQDDRPSSFQNARRYGGDSSATIGNASVDEERHIEHVYTHRQLRQLLRRINRLKGHMSVQKLVPVYIDAEFGHTRFNKSISLLQICYYSKPNRKGSTTGEKEQQQLVQRVAIIDVHQLLNTESLARRQHCLSRKKKAEEVARHNKDTLKKASSFVRPAWIPSVRWVRGRRAAYLLQQGLFGNPFVLKVLHGSNTDLILLFRSLGCHLLAPLPPSSTLSSSSSSRPLWSATPFLDTGSIDMKLRFTIWDALTGMAQEDGSSVVSDPIKDNSHDGSDTTTTTNSIAIKKRLLNIPIPTSVTNHVGLANLMRRFNTGHLKSLFLTIQNWDRRPLQEELLQYAADDVRYLHEIFFGLLKSVAIAAASVEGDRSEFEKLTRPILQRVLNDLSHFMSASDGFDSESQIASTSTSTTGFRRNASVSYSSPSKTLVLEGVDGRGELEASTDAELECTPTSSEAHSASRPEFRPYLFGPEATLLVADALSKWVDEQRKKDTTPSSPAASSPPSKSGTVYALSSKDDATTTTAGGFPLYPDADGVQRIPAAGLLGILLNADNSLLFYIMPELRPTPEVIKAGKSPTDVHFPASDASPQGRTLRSKHINVRKLIDRVQGSILRAVSKKITDIAILAEVDKVTSLTVAHQATISDTLGSLLRECGTITDPTLLAHGFNAGPKIHLLPSSSSGSGSGGSSQMGDPDDESSMVATYELDQLVDTSAKLGRTTDQSSPVLLPSLLLDPITRPPSLLSTLTKWAGHVHRVSRYNITNLEDKATVVNSNATKGGMGLSAFRKHQQQEREVMKQHKTPLLPSLSSWGSAVKNTTKNAAPSSSSPANSSQGDGSISQAKGTSTATSASVATAADGEASTPPPPTLGLVKVRLDELITSWEEEAFSLSTSKKTTTTTALHPTWMDTSATRALFRKELDIVLAAENERRAVIRGKFTPRVDDAALGCLSSLKSGLKIHRNSLISTAKKVLDTHSDAACKDILIDFHKKYDGGGSSNGDSSLSLSSNSNLDESSHQLASFVMSNHLARCHFNLVLTVAIHSILQCYSLLLQVPALPSASLSMMNFKNEIYDPQVDNNLSKLESIKLKRKKNTMSKVLSGAEGGGVSSSEGGSGGQHEDGAEMQSVTTFAASPPFPAPVLSHQFEMVVIEVMKRLEENEQIMKVKGTPARKNKSLMNSRFSTRDAKDVMRSFMGSPSNYQPTRKLVEGEMAAMAVSRGGAHQQAPWAAKIAAVIAASDRKSGRGNNVGDEAVFDVAHITSRLYYSTFASMLSASVQRTYHASEYTLSLLTHFQMSVAGVAEGITGSVLSCTTTTLMDDDTNTSNPSNIKDVLKKLRDEMEPHKEATVGAKQLGSTISVLDQYHPSRYATDEAICGAVRKSLLEGIAKSGNGGSGGGDHWSHESIVSLLIADYTLAAEEAWESQQHYHHFNSSASKDDDKINAETLKVFATSLLEDVLVPLSNNYVSAQIVEGLSTEYTGIASTTTSTTAHQPLLTSLTMGMLFAKYYHPLVRSTTRSTTTTTDATTASKATDLDRVAQVSVDHSVVHAADDIIVAQRKNYGIPLPCIITRSEFANVVVGLFALKHSQPSSKHTPKAVSSILRGAHISQRSCGSSTPSQNDGSSAMVTKPMVLLPPSPWLSAHEQHLIRLILSRF